jgi:hypothetical protein
MTASMTRAIMLSNDATEFPMTLPITFAIVDSRRTEKRIVKVLIHLLATSFLLLHKLADRLSRSIMIACVVKLNIMAMMIPGIMKKNNPRTDNTDTNVPATMRVERLVRTEFSPILIVAGFLSSVSDDTFTTNPVAIVFVIKLMMVDATIMGIMVTK